MKPEEERRALDAIFDDLQRMEAFKDQPMEIAARLPRDKQGLEARLDRLYEYLARHSTDPVGVAFTRARIEQIGRILDRIHSGQVSTREWLSFIIAAGGLLVGAGGVLLALLRR